MPKRGGGIVKSPPWYGIGSVDYYNICGYNGYMVPSNNQGNEMPHFGNAYAAFVFFVLGGPYTREYLEQKLSGKLTPGKKYCVEFYLSLADKYQYSVNKVGAYFSKNGLPGSGGIGLTPQVENSGINPLTSKSGWTKVSGSFVAEGDEEYITIGNFNTDEESDTSFVQGGIPLWTYAYYYIDDVSVTEEISAEAGKDTTICIGDSLILGATINTNITNYNWAANKSINNTGIAQPLAQPKETTIYSLTVSTNVSCQGNLSDDITVTVINCKEPYIYVPSAFSPNNDGINDILLIKSKELNEFTFKIYNRWGEEVFKTRDLTKGWDGKYLGLDMPMEVYTYLITFDVTNGYSNYRAGNLTLIR